MKGRGIGEELGMQPVAAPAGVWPVPRRLHPGLIFVSTWPVASWGSRYSSSCSRSSPSQWDSTFVQSPTAVHAFWYTITLLALAGSIVGLSLAVRAWLRGPWAVTGLVTWHHGAAVSLGDRRVRAVSLTRSGCIPHGSRRVRINTSLLMSQFGYVCSRRGGGCYNGHASAGRRTVPATPGGDA